MRDKRFVAEHRGRPLTKDNHHKLIRWARECSEHVLSLIDENADKRLLNALRVAKEWENGNKFPAFAEQWAGLLVNIVSPDPG